MERVSSILPWGILMLLFATLFYIVHGKFKRSNVWANVVNKYRDDLNERLSKETMFISKYGNIENKSLFYKLDRMILTSGLKRFFSKLNGETYFFVLVLGGFIGATVGIMCTQNLLLSLFIGLAIVVGLYVFILALSGKTYNQIEDSTSLFVSILSNYAKGSSDVVTIMERTRNSLEGPLYNLVRQFVLDAEKTGNVDVAFDFMKESIENKQLKTILINLKNCSHYQANYEEVLAQMMGQIASTLSAREERKNILFSMKLTLIVISIVSVVIVALIGSGIGVDVKEILVENRFGQGLLFVTGILYLFTLVKLFGTDK